MTNPTGKIDPEMAEFEDALLRSIDQVKRGELGCVRTPEMTMARRRGRPVGSTKPVLKVPTTIRFDADVLAAIKATGKGWQTRVNDAMREWIRSHPAA